MTSVLAVLTRPEQKAPAAAYAKYQEPAEDAAAETAVAETPTTEDATDQCEDEAGDEEEEEDETEVEQVVATRQAGAAVESDDETVELPEGTMEHFAEQHLRVSSVLPPALYNPITVQQMLDKVQTDAAAMSQIVMPTQMVARGPPPPSASR